MSEIFCFDEMFQAPALTTPLESIFAEYAAKRTGIEAIAEYVENRRGLIDFFIEGSRVEHQTMHVSALHLFEIAPAIRALDATYWSRVMGYTDILESMPAAARNQWNADIRQHKTPAFEMDTVRSTISALMAQRELFFAQRVEGVWNALSYEHVTNAPQAFKKRMIVGYMRSYGYINHDKANYIHDLRVVIARFMGRDDPRSNSTYHDLSYINDNALFGKWHSFDGGAFKIRLYKCATAHIEIHPDIAWRLNQVLAFLYPMAIPPEFRTKPAKTKAKKEFELVNELIPFNVTSELSDGKISYDEANGHSKFQCHNKLSDAAIRILEYIGGVKTNPHWNEYEFDYKVKPVLFEIQRTGIMPEQKSHQFYPTEENMAVIAVDMAEIGDNDLILEPQAGQGGIAKYLPIDQTTCVEISPLHAKILLSKGYSCVCADFLEWNSPHWFDRIVCNPPFQGGRALLHIKHAITMLKPKGILVAILPSSMKDKTIIAGMSHEWSEVFHGEFKGVSVSTVILKLQRIVK